MKMEKDLRRDVFRESYSLSFFPLTQERRVFWYFLMSLQLSKWTFIAPFEELDIPLHLMGMKDWSLTQVWARQSDLW